MSFTLGASLPTEGPGLSALIMCMAYPPPARGRIARIKTRTPMPPTQWAKLRHMSMEGESPSTSVRMLAPVVVNPDMVSNRASVREGISLLT